MYEIKKINVLSLAKFGAILGALPVIFFFIFLFIAEFFSRGYYSGPSLIPFGQLILIIFCSVVGGFLWGATAAFIYNLLAGHTGGIEMEIILKEDRRQHNEVRR